MTAKLSDALQRACQVHEAPRRSRSDWLSTFPTARVADSRRTGLILAMAFDSPLQQPIGLQARSAWIRCHTEYAPVLRLAPAGVSRRVLRSNLALLVEHAASSIGRLLTLANGCTCLFYVRPNRLLRCTSHVPWGDLSRAIGCTQISPLP